MGSRDLVEIYQGSQRLAHLELRKYGRSEEMKQYSIVQVQLLISIVVVERP
jgi:hypothetical protein